MPRTSAHTGSVIRSRELLLRARVAAPAVRQELIDEVVTMNLWLATSVARRFEHRGEELEDLVQVASAGLVEAARRFDPRQGEFLAFAIPTVTGVVKRHFRDRGWLVRPPRHTQELVAAIRREWSGLAQELGSEPTDHEVAERLLATDRDVSLARRAGQGYTAISIDVLDAMGAAVACESSMDDIARCEARIMIGSALAKLDHVERELLRMRFVEQRSQDDIAKQTGTSQMQVSRSLSRLFAKLRTDIAGDEESRRVAVGTSAAA